MPTFATVTPLHTMIRNALTALRAAREDTAPDHKEGACSRPCLCCTNARALDRLLDRLPGSKK